MSTLDAVYDFITQFTDVAPANVLRGYGQRNALPPDQDFCIFEMDDLERVGSNGQTWTDTTTTLSRLLNFSVIIDFIGNNRETQAKRAANIEILSRSLEGAAFFDAYDLSLLYAETPQYLPYIYESNAYTHRYRVTLRFCKWEELTLTEQTAQEVTVNNIVNVDTFKHEERSKE